MACNPILRHKCLFYFFIFVEQSQLDDKDRTIRIQQNLINKLEAEMNRANSGQIDATNVEHGIETVNIATQTDRVSHNDIKIYPIRWNMCYRKKKWINFEESLATSKVLKQ